VNGFIKGVANVVFVGLALILGLGLWIAFGNHSEIDGSYDFDPAKVTVDLDEYLRQSEQGVPNLRQDAAKRIVWSGDAGEKTEWSVVYLHGYSATLEEIRPVPDLVAKALGANLFFTRLSGHGRDGDAMAEPMGADWLTDTAEAMEIGRRIGDKVILIGTSTGGTLAAIAAADPLMRKDLAGIVFVSPNFKINNPMASLMGWPGARWWGPKLAGETRSFEPRNDMQAKYWTTSYPMVSTVSLVHLVNYADMMDYAGFETPALFMFSDEDQVVVASKTRDVAQKWGGDVTLDVVTMGEGDDAYSHVIAGDIVSPGQNQRAVDRIVEWIKGL
jgi:alpha-beta hydrolase superfamily lysophospholipase